MNNVQRWNELSGGEWRTALTGGEEINPDRMFTESWNNRDPWNGRDATGERRNRNCNAMARVRTGGTRVYLIDRNVNLSAPAIVTQKERLPMGALRKIGAMHHVKQYTCEDVGAQNNNREGLLERCVHVNLFLSRAMPCEYMTPGKQLQPDGAWCFQREGIRASSYENKEESIDQAREALLTF